MNVLLLLGGGGLRGNPAGANQRAPLDRFVYIFVIFMIFASMS
jgi:hypothetical protein